MHTFTAYVATQHLLDLLREAEAERLARVARHSSAADPARTGAIGRWLSRSALGLSNALNAFAARVDPAEVQPSTAASEDRRSRPLAA